MRHHTLISAAGLALAAVVGLAEPAHAYLGSFQPSDGYSLSIFTGSANWCDVTYYNAGQWGINAGNGPGPTNTVPDSGLWTLQSAAGAFFPNAAARAASVGASPPYPGSVPPGTVPAYIVGNHFPGRGGDGSNLAVRNDTALGSGAIDYDYSIDIYDTGGIVPSSVTTGTVSTSFYFCPNPGDNPNPGTPRQDKFIMSFKDQFGSIGMQWGYARDNEVYWRPGSSGPWNYTGVIADAANWDGLSVDIDLSGGSFSMDYYDVGTNTWSNMVPAGTLLGAPMGNFTTLGWHLEDGVASGIGGKNFFDDFSFSIPAPGASALIGLSGLVAARRRRA